MVSVVVETLRRGVFTAPRFGKAFLLARPVDNLVGARHPTPSNHPTHRKCLALGPSTNHARSCWGIEGTSGATTHRFTLDARRTNDGY